MVASRRLIEQYRDIPGPLKVDRDKGIIYGAKVLGWKSRNNREYTRQCADDALRRRLYEGVKVRINHHLEPGPIPSEPLFGVLHDPVVKDDGVYADLHFLRTHAMAEKVCEDVERGMGLYGLSHDAEVGTFEMRNGVQVITSLKEVNFVDLVGDGATVSNLWESRTVKIKVADTLREHVLPKLTGRRKKYLAKLLEADMDGLSMDGESGTSTKDHKQHLYDAMRACEDSGDSDMAGKIHKLLAPGKDIKEEEAETPSEEEKEIQKKAEEAARRAQTSSTVTEAKAKSLCKLAGLALDADLLESLIGTSEDKALKLLEWAKGKSSAARAPDDQIPRTGGAVRESAGSNGTPKLPAFKDSAERLAWLRN